MFEHRTAPLAPRSKFLLRVLRSGLMAAALVFASLGLGILGYHFFGRLAWIDALLNASMILTGMGPVDTLATVPGKLFASAYALFSGIVFLSAVALFIAPIFNRFLQRFHLNN